MNQETLNNLENNKAQMRKGILEYCILSIISRDKVYASDILKILKDADLLVVEGTLYPLLSRLKNSGFLDYQWQESKNGPPRKYYDLTIEGHSALKQLDLTWGKLKASIEALHYKK